MYARMAMANANAKLCVFCYTFGVEGAGGWVAGESEWCECGMVCGCGWGGVGAKNFGRDRIIFSRKRRWGWCWIRM